MTVIGDLELSVASAPSRSVASVTEGVTVRIDSVVPAEEGSVVYSWVGSDAVGQLVAALEGARVVDSVQRVDEVGDRALVKASLTAGRDRVVELFRDREVAVLDGVGTGDRWLLRVRFADHDTLQEFRAACDRRDLAVSVERVYEPTARPDGEADLLTPEQRRTLRVAWEEGYFEVPRGTSLVELSEQLGVSDSAVSQRIRRGVDRLVGARFR